LQQSLFSVVASFSGELSARHDSSLIFCEFLFRKSFSIESLLNNSFVALANAIQAYHVLNKSQICEKSRFFHIKYSKFLIFNFPFIKILQSQDKKNRSKISPAPVKKRILHPR